MSVVVRVVAELVLLLDKMRTNCESVSHWEALAWKDYYDKFCLIITAAVASSAKVSLLRTPESLEVLVLVVAVTRHCFSVVHTDRQKEEFVLRGTIQRFFSHRDDDYGEDCCGAKQQEFFLVFSSNTNKLCQPLFDLLQLVLLGRPSSLL